MRINVLGAGWYGCHLAAALLEDGHDVEIVENANHIFAGASGGNPARLHIGPHYSRSGSTRAACQSLFAAFMQKYGIFTRAVPTNIYAIAAVDSLVDFQTYCKVLRGEIEFITVHHPSDFGLRQIEGAILCGERHILINDAREHFERILDGRIRYGIKDVDDAEDDTDLVLDCTFCSHDDEGIDRFEPCVTGLLEGPADRAVTIMEGGFGSIYPWDPRDGLSSITNATLTPFSKTIRSWVDARELLDSVSKKDAISRCEQMLKRMAWHWPEAMDRYRVVDYRLSIRAMPKSAADARLVDIVRSGPKTLRIRAGKIASIFGAEKAIKEMIAEMQ